MNTEEMIAVMQAFVAGKKIQQKFLHEDEWMDIDVPEWSWCDFEYRVKPEYTFPKTWEEYCSHKDHIPDLDGFAAIGKLAEAMKALWQLIELRDCYNQGWQPDWKDDTEPKFVILSHQLNLQTTKAFTISYILTFKTSDLRDEFFTNFKGLIYKAIDLI